MTDPLDVANQIVDGAVSDYVAQVRHRFIEISTRRGRLSLEDTETLRHLPSLSREVAAQALLEHQHAMSSTTAGVIRGYLAEADAEVVGALSRLYPGRIGLSGAYAQEMAGSVAEGLAATVRYSTVQASQVMQREWVKAYGIAAAKYAQGAHYESVMEEALRHFIRDGTRILPMPTLSYRGAGGRLIHTDLDVALRRHIVTQTNQAKMRIVDHRAEEYGHDLVHVSAHFGARPDHAEWQGKVYSRTGMSSDYPSLAENTGYGTASGLCGVNCRHQFAPYAEGHSLLAEIPETMNGLTSEEHYNATQKQRRLERDVSKLKQEIELGQQVGLPMTESRLTLGHKQGALKAHADHYSLPRDYIRERAWGVGRQPIRLTSPRWLADIKPSRSIVAKTINLREVEKSVVDIVVIDGKRFLKPPRGLELTVDGKDTYLAFDGMIEEKKVFAGFGSKPYVQLRDRYLISDKWGGIPGRWKHSAGSGVLYDPRSSKLRLADIHWLENDDQIFGIRFKRWMRRK